MSDRTKSPAGPTSSIHLESTSGKSIEERIRALREGVMASRPSICLERLRLMTEAYEESGADPPVITRAKALHKVLAEMPIRINERELIVGNVTAKPPRGAPITPEFNLEWIDEEVETIDSRPLDRLLSAPRAAV